ARRVSARAGAESADDDPLHVSARSGPESANDESGDVLTTPRSQTADEDAAERATTAYPETADAEPGEVAAGTRAQPAHHDAFQLVGADTEAADADPANALARTDAEDAEGDPVDPRRPGDGNAECDAAHHPVAAIVVRRPDGRVHPVHPLEMPVTVVEPEAGHPRDVADAKADVVDREVEPLRGGGERRDQRQCQGAKSRA